MWTPLFESVRFFEKLCPLYSMKSFFKVHKQTNKQTNSSSSNSSLRSYSNLISDIASLVPHPFLNLNCVLPIKYLSLFSSFLLRSLNIIFDTFVIRLIVQWSAHYEAFIFFSIVTIIGFVKSSGHFPVS